ncbi:MAG: hypothetical protein KDD47_19765, partial [Acidobacteria bacterium]|nr:hypothetical protein [Acidobacteriota bacterium]
MVIVEALIVVASISLGASSPSFRRASAAFATVALFGALLNLSSSAVLLRQGLSAPALDSLAGVGRFATAGLLLWALWVTRRQVQVQLRSSLGVAAGLAAVAILGSLLLSPLGRAGTAWIARPWQLLPLSLLLAATVPLAGTLSDRSRGELASRLSLCLLPQIAAQLHLALASRSAFDHDFTAFLLLQLLAETTVLWILARNGLARFHRGALAVRRLEESLNRSTQDLAESRQLLVAESEGRNAAERTLRFLQAAVETTKIGVVVTDLEGRILYS